MPWQFTRFLVVMGVAIAAKWLAAPPTALAQAPKKIATGPLRVHPDNAAANGQSAQVDAQRTARIVIDLRAAPGKFTVEWYRAADGLAHGSDDIAGGDRRELIAPWPGSDIVIRLLRR